MLQVGDTAPDFELPDANMKSIKLSTFRGKMNVVLYFYLKDDTPACTVQAADFSDMEERFSSTDTMVFGISLNDCLSHASFRDKHGLTIQLLSDSDGEVCAAYGILQEKAGENGTRRCVARTTFIIDKRGILRHILQGVNPRGHAAAVFKLVKELK